MGTGGRVGPNFFPRGGPNLFPQGFRAPNAHDLSGNITSRSGQEQLGALDLEPEKSWTFELGSRFTSGDISFGAAGFYTLVDDLIISVPTAPGGDTVEATNAQEAEIIGLELEAAVRLLDNLTLSGHLTWQEGDTTSTPAARGDVAEPMEQSHPDTQTSNEQHEDDGDTSADIP